MDIVLSQRVYFSLIQLLPLDYTNYRLLKHDAQLFRLFPAGVLTYVTLNSIKLPSFDKELG
jgi:hypothetical protein